MKKYVRFIEDAAYRVYTIMALPALLVATVMVGLLAQLPEWVVNTAKKFWNIFLK